MVSLIYGKIKHTLLYTDNHYIRQCDECNEKEANQVTAGQENRSFHGGNGISALGGLGIYEIVNVMAKGILGTGDNSKSKDREHPFL